MILHCKAILDWGQPGGMRIILLWILPLALQVFSRNCFYHRQNDLTAYWNILQLNPFGSQLNWCQYVYPQPVTSSKTTITLGFSAEASIKDWEEIWRRALGILNTHWPDIIMPALRKDAVVRCTRQGKDKRKWKPVVSICLCVCFFDGVLLAIGCWDYWDVLDFRNWVELDVYFRVDIWTFCCVECVLGDLLFKQDSYLHWTEGSLSNTFLLLHKYYNNLYISYHGYNTVISLLSIVLY